MVILGFIVNGRQSNVFCDVQIEQGKIIPTEIVEFKIQKLLLLITLNQFLGALLENITTLIRRRH